MMCKAEINGKEMNMFFDSGLEGDSSLLLPKGSMDYAGIPLPELVTPGEDSVGVRRFS